MKYCQKKYLTLGDGIVSVGEGINASRVFIFITEHLVSGSAILIVLPGQADRRHGGWKLRWRPGFGADKLRQR